MRGYMGAEADELESALSLPPLSGLRVNTLKLTANEFLDLSPWPLEPVPWCPAGFLVPREERPGLHPFHAAGLYYLQDPSAMAVAEALAPRPGERVLDLAAAPGGKSTHISALLSGSGVLVSNDVHGGRARELSRNLERWGARNSLVLNESIERLAVAWPGVFDAVVLDAPCSGEGMFRKSSQATDEWNEELPAACALRQERLLDWAAPLVRPGGRLMYSTCTLNPEENEQVVEAFLGSHVGWRLSLVPLGGVDRGRAGWTRSGGLEDVTLTARLWPHRQRGEGHFVALLERDQEMVSEAGRRPGRASRNRREHEPRMREAAGSWRRFATESLTADPVAGWELSLERDGLYALPPDAPEVGDLRTLRPGLWLGRPGPREFEPSHALALALTASEAIRRVELEAEDQRAIAYLRGEELESPGEDGWVLVCLCGQPLGWGRRGRDIVKNRYPKGLRRDYRLGHT